MTNANDPARAAVRANLLGLVDAGVGVSSVLFDRWDSWALLEMPGFAGPDSTWRAIALGDNVGTGGVKRGDTYLGVPRNHGGPIIIDIEVDTPRQREMALQPGAAGATLAEVLAETRRQGATLDASVACHVLRPLLDRPVASDHALLGFDGLVRTKRTRGWERPDVPSRTFPAPMYEPDRARALLELLSSLGLRSRERPDARIKVRTTAEALAAQLAFALREPPLRSEEELRAFRDGVTGRSRDLFDAVDVIDDRVVATVVRELFAERWRCEQRVTEAVLG